MLPPETSCDAPPPSLPSQPALSAYQRRLHHEIHGPEEPLPEPLVKKQKSGTVEPLRTHSPLPTLPDDLQEKQRSLTEMREVPLQETQIQFKQRSPPYHLHHAHPPPSRGHTSPRRKSHSLVPRNKSSTVLLNSDPESVLTRYSPPLEVLVDPLEIVERLQREPELGFLYLSSVEDETSVRYNPYNLR